MIRRLLRAVLAGAALLTLVAGVPTLLILYGRSPLDGDGSLLHQLSALPTQAISDNMAFGLLTIAAWVAWVAFAQNVVVELRNTLLTANRWTPLRWSPFDMTARRLVTALTMTVSLGTSLGAKAGSLPPLRPAAAEQPAPPADATTADPAPGAQRGDPLRPSPHPSPNAAVAPLLTSPDLNEATSASFQVTAGTLATTEQAEPVVITVAPGDSPWTLAVTHLGDGLRWRELWDLNRGVLQADGRGWVVEDLIRPGWTLALPTPTNEAPPLPPTVEDPPPPSDQPPPATCTPGMGEGQPDAEGDVDDTTAGPADNAPTTSTTATPPVTDPPPAGRPPETSPDTPDDRHELLPDVAPPLAGITGATVIATSVALLLRRLRRDRSVRTARSWRRVGTRRGARAEHAIASAADVPLVRWAGQELASVMQRVKPDTLGGATPVALELSEARGIEVLWERPVPDAPIPWAAIDDGWAWSLPYDPEAPVPPDLQTSPIPALVTIGEREGRQLMIDLEAFGSVSVVGNPERVADFGRAIAFELGADEDLADAYVSTVGFGIGLDDHLRRVATSAPDDAIAKVRATAAAVGESLREAQQNSTFSYRIADDGSYLEATVVVMDAHSDPAAAVDLVQASQPHRAAAAVLLGETAGARATIDIADDGLAHLAPLGIVFVAAGLPAETDHELAHLLSDETERADDLDDTTGVAGGPELPEPTVAELDPMAPETFDETRHVAPGGPLDDLLPDLRDAALESNDAEPPQRSPEDTTKSTTDSSMIVKVLGTPFVPARTNLRRRELLLTVYMACRARPVTPSSIQNAVWGGRAVEPKTLWNVVARTRTALGNFDDGTPVMPPNDRRGGTLCLSDRVVTDLALLQHSYTQALQLPSSEAIYLLRRGLALIEGEPFNAPGYEWAYRDEQFVAEASTLIENAVEHLVRLAEDAADLDAAREALAHGLRGLPGNEVLYRSRMRLEHGVGNIAGVETAWKELSDFLLDLDMEPSDATVALYTELTRRR